MVSAQLFSFTELRGAWGPRLVHGLHRGSAASWPVWRVHCPALPWKVTLPPLAVTLGSTCGAFSGGGVSTWWTRWSHRKWRLVDELPGVECGKEGFRPHGGLAGTAHPGCWVWAPPS